MSDKKETRSIAEIQKEYSELCLKAGHTQYQIFTLNKDLSLVNDQLRDLNFEAASVRANEEQESAKVAEGAKNE